MVNVHAVKTESFLCISIQLKLCIIFSDNYNNYVRKSMINNSF